jgi:hypothetical protein
MTCDEHNFVLVAKNELFPTERINKCTVSFTFTLIAIVSSPILVNGITRFVSFNVLEYDRTSWIGVQPVMWLFAMQGGKKQSYCTFLTFTSQTKFPVLKWSWSIWSWPLLAIHYIIISIIGPLPLILFMIHKTNVCCNIIK